MVIEEIVLPTTFVTEWASIGYCKTSDFFFWLISVVSSPPLLTTMRFPHSLLMNTILAESFKFPMSSLSIQSSFSPNVRTFSEGLPFSMKLWFFFKNKTRKIKRVNICKHSMSSRFYFIYIIFVSLALSKKS